MQQMISGLGLVVLVFIAWLLSSDRQNVRIRLVIGGVILQLILAVTVLWTSPGQWFFKAIGELFIELLSFVDVGSSFVFNAYPQEGDAALPPPYILLRTFAFGVMPTVVFFSSLMGILYHIGIMQRIVSILARIMQMTLGTSGAESLAAAANVFVGQTEAPLVVRPYISEMTQSELHALMVGGFATISGGLLAAYVGMGIDPSHLLTAAVISAPASLVISKVMVPETEESKTLGCVSIQHKSEAANVIEAAAIGASEGMKLVLNIIAMLIAFLALIALLDAVLAKTGYVFGFREGWQWSVSGLLSYLFAPLAFILGIEWKDCLPAGELLGLKMAANEFIAYEKLGSWLKSESTVQLEERSKTILVYALSGFSNFAAIGIQLGGIGGLAPDRRGDLARYGLRAMIGGTLACCMTACVAGMLVS